MAGRSPTDVRSSTAPENVVPMRLSCTKRPPASSSPIASTTAMTADVPVPHGERSTCASAKTVTFRRWAPSASGGPVKIVP